MRTEIRPEESGHLDLGRWSVALDVGQLEGFDRLTRLAARLLDAPVAAIRLLSGTGQRTVSVFGQTLGEVGDEDSFCAYTAAGVDPLVVPDTVTDARFNDHPLVTGGAGIRFYAGAPVRSRSGDLLATICVMDTEPRQLDETQLETLADLAALLGTELDRVGLQRSLELNQHLEQRYAAIFANAAEALILVAPDGSVLLSNDGFNRLLDYPPGTITAESYTDYVHPDDLPLAHKVMRVAAVEGSLRIESVDVRVRAADGTWRWLEIWLHDLTDDPSVGAVLLSARDITPHLGVSEIQREVNERLNATLATGKNTFVEFDEAGNVVSVFGELAGVLGEAGRAISRIADLRRLLVDPTGKPFADWYRPIAGAVFQGQHLTDELVGLPLTGSGEPVGSGNASDIVTDAGDGGGLRWLSLSTAPLSVAGRRHTVLSIADVTHARTLERELARNHRRYELIFEHTTDILAVVDAHGQVLFSSPSAERVLGHAVDDRRPGGLLSYIHPDDRNIITDVFLKVLQNRWDSEERVVVRAATADGDWVYLESTATNLLYEPSIRGVLMSARDVTSRELLTQALAHQAMRDPLTGIFNRRAFGESLNRALARASRSGDRIALLWLDLDNFKGINDNYGHAAGDAVLVEVARRLTAIVRAGDIVGRFGGDEFAIVLEPISNVEDVTTMADRVLTALAEPIPFDDLELTCGPSIGLAVAEGGTDADQLMARADAAMYAAKRNGGGRIALG